MDAGIIKEETDMCNLVSTNDFLKAYTDVDIDYIDSSMPMYKDYEYNLKLFYKGIERYAKSFGVEAEELFDRTVTRYRIEYNNLIIAIGMELNIKSFLKMWKIPTLFTIIQVLGSAILAVILSHVFGFSVYVSLLTVNTVLFPAPSVYVYSPKYLDKSGSGIAV